MPSPSRLAPLLLLALLGACDGDEGQATTEAETTVDKTVMAPNSDDIGEVIATVHGIPIGAREFEAAAARSAPRSGDALSDEDKQEILDELVAEKMLYLEAKRQGIDLDPKVQKVMVNTLLRQEVYANVRNSDFTPEELQAYYEDHKDEFVVPEKLQVRRIFIKADPTRSDAEARGMAEEVHAKVVADPTSFKELASEHSEDPYRRRGGDLGFMDGEGKPGIPSEVTDTAFGLDVGDVSEPFLAGGGYNIVMVASKRDRIERTFEQMKGSVLRKVKNDRYKDLYADYIDSIRDDFDVEVEEDVLAGIDIRPSRRMPLGLDRHPMRPRDADADAEEAPDSE